MAMTRDERSEQALCGAKRKNGEPCRLFAGQGTSHKGIGRCKLHGGSTGTHEKAAIKRGLTKKMVMMGEPVTNVSARQALRQEMGPSTGHVSFLRQARADMGQEELGSPYGVAVTSLYKSERARKTRVAPPRIESGVGGG